MGQLESRIFQGKSFSSLLEEIYTNQTIKKGQLESLINDLKPLINDVGDATLLVPLIKEYLDIGIKNDDHLIKLGNLIQKVLLNESDDVDTLSDSEKEELLKLQGEVKDKK